MAKIFPEIFEQDSQQFLDGSARIALQVRPRFTKYIFIERDIDRIVELQKLKSEFKELRDDIVVIQADANSYLQDLCLNRRWSKNRAVLFLDPFGMQVTWDTIAAIAATKAIDLWLLFPIGAVNRLLPRNAQISAAWRKTLDRVVSEGYTYRIDHLRQTGAAIKFLSLEPLLGPLDDLKLDGIDWVIAGGESGPGARLMDPEWVFSIRNQCVQAGVPFFFKQWGGVWKKKFGRTLEGRTWDQMPFDSRLESVVA